MAAEIQNKIDRIETAVDYLEKQETECRLCPRECRVNRHSGETGFCGSGNSPSLSHSIIHKGEEPVLSGFFDYSKKQQKKITGCSGSGTIFFSGCNLKCSFCQNYQLSWENKGKTITEEKLADLMLYLQDEGALNINFVSPTHQIPPILKALKIAIIRGLELPIVYNTNSYEKVTVLKHLEGIIDIFLPDLKYLSSQSSERYSGTRDYFYFAGEAIKEMARQQTVLILDSSETARKGLIVRHLVLPGQTEDSIAILEWISANLCSSIPISLMSQYHPCFKAPPEIQRNLTEKEYKKILKKAEDLGFESLFIQPGPFPQDEHLIPDFTRDDPFEKNTKHEKR